MRRLLALAVLAAAAGCAEPGVKGGGAAQNAPPPRKAPYAVFVTDRGVIEARLFPDDAPKTVANFSDLAMGRKEWTDPATGQKTQRPLYNGTLFFRVIPGFLIQAGDPANAGSGGPGYALDNEAKPTHSFDRPGMLATVSLDSSANGSQFFISLTSAPWLNGKQTIFGEITKGLDVAQAIGSSERTVYDPSGRQIDRPKQPVALREVRIEER